MVDQKGREDMSLDQLLLDHASRKYYLVNYALRWVKEVKKREDAPKTAQGIMAVALHEILTGKVTYKEIDKIGSVREGKKESGTSGKDGKKG